MKLKRDSPLIASWLARVRLFYVEASEKLKKYFSASLKSKTMQFLSVLSPRAVKSQKLAHFPKDVFYHRDGEDEMIFSRGESDLEWELEISDC